MVRAESGSPNRSVEIRAQDDFGQALLARSRRLLSIGAQVTTAARTTPKKATVAFSNADAARSASGENRPTAAYAGLSANGETRTRTGDTTIFSRVLYQLSYLAEARRGYPGVSGPRCPRP